MDEIASLLEQLQDGDKDRRYDACERLRVADVLPQEAREALRRAISDPDPQVSDAAASALAAHTHSKGTATPQPLSSSPSSGGPQIGASLLVPAVMLTCVLSSIIVFVFPHPGGWIDGLVIGSVVLVPGVAAAGAVSASIAYALSRRQSVAFVVSALVGILLGLLMAWMFG